MKQSIIKDEKLRRAIIAWSLAYNENNNKEVRCVHYRQATELVATDNCFVKITLPLIDNLIDLETYTIAELCGEIDCGSYKLPEWWH